MSDANRTILQVNRLETRLTPAAPTISNLSGRIVGNHWVVTGQVLDEDPGQATVAISGSVSGSAAVKPNGSFEFIIQHTGDGSVSAAATDVESLTSDTVKENVNAGSGNQAPYLTLKVAYGLHRTISLSGRVYDESPNGLTVNFSGKATGYTTTDAAGNFSFPVTASGLGNVSATVSDGAGVASSNTPVVTLVSDVPSISDFTATYLSYNVYKFRGRVTDECPMGLTVTLYSGITGVNGRIDIADSDGWFELMVTLPPNSSGTVTAKVKDWWEQESTGVHVTI